MVPVLPPLLSVESAAAFHGPSSPETKVLYWPPEQVVETAASCCVQAALVFVTSAPFAVELRSTYVEAANRPATSSIMPAVGAAVLPTRTLLWKMVFCVDVTRVKAPVGAG